MAQSLPIYSGRRIIGRPSRACQRMEHSYDLSRMTYSQTEMRLRTRRHVSGPFSPIAVAVFMNKRASIFRAFPGM
ncbi:hypothetical protein COMA2_20234 [Candidatus Nitrospira nitrificans]|uniref:Uncharacterized protein n=1 Tax=Candidatus Nitrospira nitrificans TaxID=1742973 RepID=A0A0S4LFJ7_9BACT|nr:hypothetical protein COMA2_20234 [Candidatus Nitrospira nitrificans]